MLGQAHVKKLSSLKKWKFILPGAQLFLWLDLVKSSPPKVNLQLPRLVAPSDIFNFVPNFFAVTPHRNYSGVSIACWILR